MLEGAKLDSCLATLSLLDASTIMFDIAVPLAPLPQCIHMCFKICDTTLQAPPERPRNHLGHIGPNNCMPCLRFRVRYQAGVAAHVSAGSVCTVARARVNSPARVLDTLVPLSPAGSSIGAIHGPSSMQLVSAAEGAIGIMQMALTPS